jgi:ADP-heptose:LPS heptosyltransferase
VAASAGRVTFVCGPYGRPAAELLPGVDRIVELDAPWIALDAAPFDAGAIAAFVETVAADRPDAAVVLTSFHQSPLPLALLLRLAGVTTVAASSVDHPGSLVEVRRRPEDDDGSHEVERALRLVAMLGCRLRPGDGGGLAVRRPRPCPLLVDGLDGEPFVVVHPGASVPARGVPAEPARRFVDLVVAAGHRVVVTGAAREAELVGHVAGRPRAAVNALAGGTTLAELGGLLDAAAVVVTGNTGPAHLAAAVATPVVSVFAPVVPAERWAPWQAEGRLLGDQTVACAGCRARTCPYPGQPCLRDVTAERLFEAASGWLGGAGSRDGAVPAEVTT